MAATTDTLERETKLQGMGSSRLRKEDARFIRGKGSYVDDIKLPGMLFGAMVRSPYAHALQLGLALERVGGNGHGGFSRCLGMGQARADASFFAACCTALTMFW